MNENIKQLEYIRSQLAWIKSKVGLDNQLGLYDINKLGEDIFMHILNDVYDLNLRNANDILHDNFPSIDLVDEGNERVIQVTSTITLKKAKGTISKLKDLKFHEISEETTNSLKNSISFFRKLNNYEEYKISFLYLHEKPNIKTKAWKEFLEKENLTEDNFIGIDDIVKIVQANPTKCEMLYKTIQQRMDAISFKFNIDSYFKQAEPHLMEITDSKFQQYEPIFIEFIESKKKVLEVYAVGGSGKSHLLRYFSDIETEYIPLIFTKQINIEEDLKKLDSTKKYLFIFDDIDRFLDQPILLSLLSYTINRENIKLLLSYRTASKNTIKTIFRRYNWIESQELEVIWKQNEIKLLIHSLLPNLDKEKITKLAYTFNNNPYLITQAISGNIETIKEFSQKIIDDTKRGLEEFDLNDKDIKDLLFRLSLIVPISEREIEQYFDKNIIQKLKDIKILRKLASKYRFNPDIQGDLYLANYIDENQNGFDEKIEELFPIFSDTLFTNLSYALVYNESDSLQDFIKSIINRWIENKEFSSEYLYLIDKIVYFAPMESFIYLDKATKNLIPQETNNLFHIKNQLGNNNISIQVIEPIISKIIYAFKNNIPTEKLKINHIIRYLTSDIVMNLPKPEYDNQTLDSIFEKLVSPLDTRNFDVIFKTLDLMIEWLYEKPLHPQKIQFLLNSVKFLLQATFSNTSYDGINFSINNQNLNIEHPKFSKLVKKSKNILLKLLEYNNEDIVIEAVDIVIHIGNGILRNKLGKKSELFYSNLRKEVFLKCVELLHEKQSFKIQSKIENIGIWALKFSFEDKEALSILENIKRSHEYNFYRMIQGNDFLCFDYDECEKEYIRNKDNIKTINFPVRKIFETEDEIFELKREIIDKQNLIVEKIFSNSKNIDEIIKLLNTLDLDSYSSNNKLKEIFIKLLQSRNSLFVNIAQNYLNKIDNISVQNITKEVLYQEGFITINVDDISTETKKEELLIYINTAFKHKNSIEILYKIVEVSKSKDRDYLAWLISAISSSILFRIDNLEVYKEFEPIIIQFLNWQLEYNLFDNNPSIIYFLHSRIEKNVISKKIKKILESIVRTININIDEFNLKTIYEILDYGLNEAIDILYNKLTSKKEDGTYRYYFTHYFDHSDITEVLLIKSYVHDYEDFKFLVDKTLEYYLTPVEIVRKDNIEYVLRIHLDYFLKYAVKQEYIEQLFDELVSNNDIEKIKFLYTIVPVSHDYLNVIIRNLNLLEDIVEERELMDYLKQIGKIKLRSRSYMENSDLVLSEEALFTELYNKVNSLLLQSKLKEELKYLEIQKKQEIEEDISRLLDK